MIGELVRYRASCDRCHILHPIIAPTKWMLRDVIRKDGWKVTGDDVMCPDCIAKEAEE